jgi:hypothetical protein
MSFALRDIFRIPVDSHLLGMAREYNLNEVVLSLACITYGLFGFDLKLTQLLVSLVRG